MFKKIKLSHDLMPSFLPMQSDGLLPPTEEENGSSGLWPTMTSSDLCRIMKKSDGVDRY
jgi:hypothetical protein